MKKLLVGAALGAAFISVPATAQEAAEKTVEAPAPQPVDPAKLALARQIVDNGFPEDTREAIFFGTVDQMTEQMREASLANLGTQDPGVIAVFDQWLADYLVDSKQVLRNYIPRMMDALAQSYAVMFTKTELRDIAAFVSTPSGQRFTELSQAVMAEPHFAAVNQQYMNEIQAGLPAATQDLQARLMEYAASEKGGNSST